jgi:hypothetical protein
LTRCTGIWHKELRPRSNLEPKRINTIIKRLTRDNYIQTVKSVVVRFTCAWPCHGQPHALECLSRGRCPTLTTPLPTHPLLSLIPCAAHTTQANKKRLYMLAGLVPDVSLTGGPWYAEDDFDADFVDTLRKLGTPGPSFWWGRGKGGTAARSASCCTRTTSSCSRSRSPVAWRWWQQ